MDFLFWIDIHNKYGINHITTMIGPIFNVGQPVILYILKLLYYKPKQINLPLHFLNLFYVIYMCTCMRVIYVVCQEVCLDCKVCTHFFFLQL